MDYSTTLQQLFETEVDNNPHKTALVFGKKQLTYSELNSKANQVAHYLQQLGIKPNMPVVLCMARSFEFFIALLGVLKAGGAYIPLDYTQPQARLLSIINESKAAVVITDESLHSSFSAYQGKTLRLKEEILSQQETSNPQPVADSTHLAYAIYTSGSTGTPKGVLITHQSIVNYARWFAKECVRNAQDTIDCSANPAFDFALTLTVVPLVLGLKVVLCEEEVKKDPRRYLAHLREHAISLIKITPSYFQVLYFEAQHQPQALTHLKKIMLGGENLLSKDCKNWLRLYPHHLLFNEYGPTEATVAVTLYEVNQQNIHSCADIVPIGYPMPHAYYYILDENKKPVAPGESGELYLGGICVAQGYLNNPTTTARFFIEDPFVNSAEKPKIYKTGDLCRLLPNGALDCMGRIDHQLKIRGFRVELEEIEQCLLHHPAIKSAVVVASDQWGTEKKLIAYYIPRQPDLAEKELKQYCMERLPDYMIPSFFMAMSAFPRTANDKLDRAALPLPTRTQHLTQPKTSLEKKLAHIWSDELGIDQIGLHDHFFELGGHSLAAARVISKINHHFKKELSLQDFYQEPTLAALTAKIKSAPKYKPLKKMSLKAKNKVFPLSDFQLLLWLADVFEPKAKRLNIFTRKRVLGHLNSERLNKAVDRLIQKHPVLSYKIAAFNPQHVLQKQLEQPLEEYAIQHLTLKDSNNLLNQSFAFLQNNQLWPKNKAQLLIRAFYLRDNTTELQLSLPHVIADDLCPDILLNDLSRFYLYPDTPATPHRAYQEYIAREKHYVKQNAAKDNAFWQSYLSDTGLFRMPKEQIQPLMQQQEIPYSTYQIIPEATLQQFKHYCAQHHIGLLNGLCAALVLALQISTDYQNEQPVCINRVKSTREDEDYDQAIGCFLRLEPIKINCDREDHLLSLTQKIHQELMQTTPFQKASSLVKLASLAVFNKTPLLRQYAIQSGLWLYNALTGFQLDKPTLKSTSRMHALTGEEFLINVNVQSSFIQSVAEKKTHYFGMEVQARVEQPMDLLTINNLLDVCFLRQEDQLPVLVLSANLNPAFRERIAHHFLEVLCHNMLSKNTTKTTALIP